METIRKKAIKLVLDRKKKNKKQKKQKIATQKEISTRYPRQHLLAPGQP